MPAVNWGQRPSKKNVAADLDLFVKQNKAKPATRRLNLNIPVELHARIKAQCAMKGLDMTEALTELLEERFPEKGKRRGE